jgi:hypothetical protein
LPKLQTTRANETSTASADAAAATKKVNVMTIARSHFRHMPGLAGSSGIPLAKPCSATIRRHGWPGITTSFASNAPLPFQDI